MRRVPRVSTVGILYLISKCKQSFSLVVAAVPSSLHPFALCAREEPRSAFFFLTQRGERRATQLR